MKIDIGIINFNTKDLLAQCLDSVARQDKAMLAQTLVVDNNSSDGSIGLVKERYPNVKIIANKENKGFAAAANQIIDQARNDLVLVLNADTILQEKSLQNLVSFMEGVPRAGAVGPVLLNPDGSIQASGRQFPSFKDAAIHAFLGVIRPNNKYSRRYKRLDWERNNKEEVDWVSGAAVCLRKRAVKEIGLFDEQYFMYVEDMDLCFRLWQNDWKVFLLPEAKVIHYVGQSSKLVNTKMIMQFEKSIYRFYMKQNSDNWKRWLAPLIKIGLRIRSRLLILTSR